MAPAEAGDLISRGSSEYGPKAIGFAMPLHMIEVRESVTLVVGVPFAIEDDLAPGVVGRRARPTAPEGEVLGCNRASAWLEGRTCHAVEQQMRRRADRRVCLGGPRATTAVMGRVAAATRQHQESNHCPARSHEPHVPRGLLLTLCHDAMQLRRRQTSEPPGRPSQASAGSRAGRPADKTAPLATRSRGAAPGRSAGRRDREV